MPRFSWLFWVLVGLALGAPLCALWQLGLIYPWEGGRDSAITISLSLGLSAIGIITGMRVFGSAVAQSGTAYTVTTRLIAALSALWKGVLRGALVGGASVPAWAFSGRPLDGFNVLIICLIYGAGFGAILSGSTALLFGTGIGQQPPTNNQLR